MTGSNDNRETHDFAPDGVVQRLFRGPADAQYRLIVWMFVLASATHLWLADAAHPDWLPANLVYIAGLAILAVGRGALGWWLCTVGLLIPLLFLRDQLTQSLFLSVVSATGGLFVFIDASRRAEGAEGYGIAAFVRLLQGLTIATYAFAAFHKLNRDFFDADLGCATYGMRELAVYYGFEPSTFDVLGWSHAPLAVGLELAIPAAYLLGRRHIARVLAVVFHLPLTLTMAPAFAFVMATGHAAFVSDAEREALFSWIERHAWWVIPAGAAITGISLVVHGALPEWTMIPREFVLWCCLLWFVGFMPVAARRSFDVSSPRLPGRYRAFVAAVLIAFGVNAVTPYLGVQYQHAAAMLSNLRIDEGCWNHFVVPESVRVTDDYVRVDAVWFVEPGALPEYESIVLEQLWSPPQIRQMRRNWCREELRPFHMSGTFRGRRWEISDLCDEQESWPFDDAGVFGVEVFGDFLRFQKNLERECPQSCIH